MSNTPVTAYRERTWMTHNPYTGNYKTVSKVLNDDFSISVWYSKDSFK